VKSIENAPSNWARRGSAGSGLLSALLVGLGAIVLPWFTLRVGAPDHSRVVRHYTLEQFASFATGNGLGSSYRLSYLALVSAGIVIALCSFAILIGGPRRQRLSQLAAVVILLSSIAVACIALAVPMPHLLLSPSEGFRAFNFVVGPARWVCILCIIPASAANIFLMRSLVIHQQPTTRGSPGFEAPALHP
jgi:hypothetical protein